MRTMLGVGDEARAIEAILEGEEKVDPIVADLRMPGMPGAELVSRARARYPQVAAIRISAKMGACVGPTSAATPSSPATSAT